MRTTAKNDRTLEQHFRDLRQLLVEYARMQRQQARSVPSSHSTVHCNIEWHCAASGLKWAVSVYHIAARISKDSGRFAVSIPTMAEYLGADQSPIRDAYRFLLKNGFFVLIREVPGASTEYHVVAHKEWSEKYPDKCCLKLVLPDKDDKLAKALHGITGRTFYGNYMAAIRKCGFTDEYVIACARTVQAEHVKNPKGSFHNKFAKHLSERRVR